MNPFETWTWTGKSLRIRWVWDDDYQTADSYALATEEETRAAIRWECERLNDGRLVVLGCITERRCEHCGNWDVIDSLWGIVIEPDEANLREFYRESVGRVA